MARADLPRFWGMECPGGGGQVHTAWPKRPALLGQEARDLGYQMKFRFFRPEAPALVDLQEWYRILGTVWR